MLKVSHEYLAYNNKLATHSSVLAWRIPRMGEPGGLPPMGSHRVRHDGSDLAAAAAAFTHRSLPRTYCVAQGPPLSTL